MSKAFTRESDDEKALPVARPAVVLPPGTPNYLTPDGAERLRTELHRLVEHDRAALRSAATEEAGGRLRGLEQRIAEIEGILSTAKIVTAPPRPWEQVGFGAFVTVRMQDREEVTYRIVGVHEVDLDRCWLSWLTPVARALINGRIGERVTLHLPGGGRSEMEILAIDYPVAD